MSSGIYQIRNIINNKCYIGSAANIDIRWKRHKYDLKRNVHHSILLQRAWNKCGENGFIFEIIEEILDKSSLIDREQCYLDTLNPKYNIYKIAGSCLGIKRSEEYKKRMSISTSGEKNGMYGKKHSKETLEKMRLVQLGKKHSEEHKRKISIAISGENNPNYGREFSKKHREKIGLFSKIRNSGSNNPVSKENRLKRKLFAEASIK